jgi:hypothetical protein
VTNHSVEVHVNQHLRTHTEEKDYKCNESEKTFDQSTYLIQHQGMHNAEKPYQYQYKESGKFITVSVYCAQH